MQEQKTKKLKIGWFSFSCCEDSTIIFTEMLNDHFKEWSNVMDFQHVRILKRNNKLKGLDVSFIEGAIASKSDAKKLQKIRKNSKRIVAVGSCACTGMPSAQRNNFSPELRREIQFLIRKFNQAEKVRKVEEVVKVDYKVSGCPMTEQGFLNVVDKLFKEFGIK